MTQLNRRHLILSAGAGLALTAAPKGAFAQAARPGLVVHRDPTCGCCGAWAELSRKAGYDVTVNDVDDIEAKKTELGVPGDLRACHTAVLDGYVIEGHVPFDAVARLRSERPDIAGIAVPGMPMGSPGMGNDPAAQFDVIAWGGTAGAGTVWHRAGRG